VRLKTADQLAQDTAKIVSHSPPVSQSHGERPARCDTDRSLADRDGFFRKNSACLIKSRYSATGQLHRRKTMTQLDAVESNFVLRNKYSGQKRGDNDDVEPGSMVRYNYQRSI
jgi:hypothetical protein